MRVVNVESHKYWQKGVTRPDVALRKAFCLCLKR